MYFEAELKNKKYFITVVEERDCWNVCLQEEGQQKEQHIIPKNHFKSLDGAISFIFQNSSYMVDVVGVGTNYSVYTRGSYREIPLYNDESLLHESLKGGKSLSGSNNLSCGMPGKIVDVMVKAGDEVKEGQPILIMEAMKMENEMRALKDAKIKDVLVAKGDNVDSGSVLVEFEV